MDWIQSYFETIPTFWAVLALVAAIGLSVLFLRGLIRLAFRALLIGLIGLVVLGVVYYLI
jgi:hypothetical protein